MNKRFVFPVLLAGLCMITGCTGSKSFQPSHGGQVDTLHNEIHVENFDVLLLLTEDDYGKNPNKIYFTDDDGLKYQWSEEKGYYCVSETNTTINFYFDNTQTTDEDGNDCPIFSIKWYLLKPLDKAPEELSDSAGNLDVSKIIALGAAKGFAPTEAFPNFIGFSFYSTCLDEENLWNFKTDYRQQAVTNLYGIWVD